MTNDRDTAGGGLETSKVKKNRLSGTMCDKRASVCIKSKGAGRVSGVDAVVLLPPFLRSQAPRPREARPPHKPIHSFVSEEGRRDVAATQQQRLTFRFLFFFLHGRTEESLSPGATSPRLLDALSFIQCEIAAINPALREAYHSGAFVFLLTRLV